MQNHAHTVKYGYDRLPKMHKYKFDDIPRASQGNLLEALEEYISKKVSIRVLTYILITYVFQFVRPIMTRVKLMELCLNKTDPVIQLLLNYSTGYSSWCIRAISGIVSYCFVSGPYKGCWCLFGYNPYDYQTIPNTINDTITSTNSIIDADTGSNSDVVSNTIDNDTNTNTNTDSNSNSNPHSTISIVQSNLFKYSQCVFGILCIIKIWDN